MGHIPNGYDEDDVIADFYENELPLPVSVRIKHADPNYGFVGFERECQALDVLVEASGNKHCLTWTKTGEPAKIKVDVAFFLLSRAEGDRGLTSQGTACWGRGPCGEWGDGSVGGEGSRDSNAYACSMH